MLTPSRPVADRSGRNRRDCLLSLAPAIAVIGTLAGCYSEGGPGFSSDRYTYVSDSYKPWTVTLKDVRTGQVLWSADVPVGKQLVVQFLENRGTKDQSTPDLMQWQIMAAGKSFGSLENALPVPPAYARRLEPELRKIPELPEDMTATGQQPKPPVITVPAPSPSPTPPPSTNPPR
jgi:hypothetical protein